MKAQSFFGGTNPKASGKKAKQFGHNSATPGVNSHENNRGQAKNDQTAARQDHGVPHGSIERRTTVNQTRSSAVPSNISRRTRVRQVGHKGGAA